MTGKRPNVTREKNNTVIPRLDRGIHKGDVRPAENPEILFRNCGTFSNQAHFLSGNDGLRTVGYADGAQQSVDMQLDGSLGNAHLIGNLFIGQSLRDQIQNLSLPISQGFAFGLGAVAVGLRRAAAFNQSRRDIGSAVQNQLQGTV